MRKFLQLQGIKLLRNKTKPNTASELLGTGFQGQRDLRILLWKALCQNSFKSKLIALWKFCNKNF